MEYYPSGTRIAGRYEVAGRPLVGGMGIVYLCFDHQEQRPVALKTFKPEFLPDRAARERFLEEGNTWMRLGKHPHIVQAYSVERIGDGREVYLVLELVAKEEGRRDASLRSWLTLGRLLSVDQALLIALQVARGMRHATETIPGFVHRDLKPENVLVGADRLSNAPINRVRVTDFGLVKGLRAEQAPTETAPDLAQGLSRLTRIGSIVGTPHYMAPEQWEASDVAMQADIYALGCILGEMLVGRMLVQGGTLDEVRQAHQDGQVMRTMRLVPDAVRVLLAGCLAVEPGRRHRDWATLQAAVVTAYHQVARRPAPRAEAADTLSRADRVAAGWSYSAMGVSFVDVGKVNAALSYFERAQQTGQGTGERRLEAAGLAHLGNVYLRLGDAPRAIGYFEHALAINREICAASTKGFPEWTACRHDEGTTMGNLGIAYRELGDARRAIGYFEQALVIAREIGDRIGEGGALGNLGNTFDDLSDARRAIDYFQQALAIAREIGDRRGESASLGNLGIAYGRLGDARQAVGYHERALVIAREIGERHGEGTTLGNLGIAYGQLGDAQRAIGYFEQAQVIACEIGDRRGEGYALVGLGNGYRQLGDAQQAIGNFKQAVAIHRDIGNRMGEGAGLTGLANTYLQLGDTQRAIGYFEHSLAICRKISDRQGEGDNLGNLGSACLQLNDTQRAIGYFEQALAIHRDIGDIDGAATGSFNLALLYAEQGDLTQALPLAREAARLVTQMGQTARAQQAQQLVARLERQGH